VTALKIGDALHASDLKLPPGVKVMLDPKEALASVVAPRAEKSRRLLQARFPPRARFPPKVRRRLPVRRPARRPARRRLQALRQRQGPRGLRPQGPRGPVRKEGAGEEGQVTLLGRNGICRVQMRCGYCGPRQSRIALRTQPTQCGLHGGR